MPAVTMRSPKLMTRRSYSPVPGCNAKPQSRKDAETQSRYTVSCLVHFRYVSKPEYEALKAEWRAEVNQATDEKADTGASQKPPAQ